jgi:hypothetical protein
VVCNFFNLVKTVKIKLNKWLLFLCCRKLFVNQMGLSPVLAPCNRCVSPKYLERDSSTKGSSKGELGSCFHREGY